MTRTVAVAVAVAVAVEEPLCLTGESMIHKEVYQNDVGSQDQKQMGVF